jgi:hypothetical protein
MNRQRSPIAEPRYQRLGETVAARSQTASTTSFRLSRELVRQRFATTCEGPRNRTATIPPSRPCNWFRRPAQSGTGKATVYVYRPICDQPIVPGSSWRSGRQRNSTLRTRLQVLGPPVEDHTILRRIGSVPGFSFGNRLPECVPVQIVAAVWAVVVRGHPTNHQGLLVGASVRVRQTLNP